MPSYVDNLSINVGRFGFPYPPYPSIEDRGMMSFPNLNYEEEGYGFSNPVIFYFINNNASPGTGSISSSITYAKTGLPAYWVMADGTYFESTTTAPTYTFVNQTPNYQQQFYCMIYDPASVTSFTLGFSNQSFLSWKGIERLYNLTTLTLNQSAVLGGVGGLLFPDPSRLYNLTSYQTVGNGTTVNMIVGNFPDISNCTALTTFSISGMKATGVICDLSNLKSLLTFNVAGNTNLGGPIPALPASITSFTANQCNLSGNFPDLSLCTSLVTLVVNVNNLAGPISVWPTTLATLQLNNNLLSGTIPTFTGLTVIASVQLQTNSFTIYTASTLSSTLSTFNLSGNSLSIASCDQILSDFVTQNRSSGTINIGTAPMGVPTKAIKYVTSITGGSLYVVNDTITPTNGGGSGCILTVATVSSGSVTSVTITGGGSGYTSAPTTFITSGSGTGFTATLRTDILKLVANGMTVTTT